MKAWMILVGNCLALTLHILFGNAADFPLVAGSIVSGSLGAILGSKAQKDAAAKNLQAARETNEANYRMFQEGRGSTGSAFLPLYFGGRERGLANDAMSFYDATKNMLGTPQDQFNRYATTLGGYQPMVNAARGTLGDVFNGNITNSRMEFLQPVNAARTNYAKSQQQGVLGALQERINALNASSAKKGYSGTGSFNQNRLLNSTVPMRQAAAGVMAGADLANAQDVRGVQDQGMEARLRYMDMPFQQAQQALAMEMMPLSQVQQNFSRSMAPFDFFKMGPQSFRADPLPMQGADTTWPAIMNSIGNANSGLSSLWMNGAFGGKGAGAAGATGGWGGADWASGMA